MGAIELPPDIVPLPPAADVPNASSPTQRDPSAAITVIQRKSRVARSESWAELVAASPGAVIQDQGGAGQRKTLSLRGASPNSVLVLLDGVPLNGPGNGLSRAQ